MRTIFKTLDQAESFLRQNGFILSKSIWFKKEDGIAVVILAPHMNRSDTTWELARVKNYPSWLSRETK